MKEDMPHGILLTAQALRALTLCLMVLAAFSWFLPRAAATTAMPEAVPTLGRAASAPRVLVPIGKTVGIKLFSDGVLVIGLSDLATDDGVESPAKVCGLREGDIITHINSSEVDTIEQVQAILRELEDEEMSIRAMRGEKQIQITAQAERTSEGDYKLGAWIRDSMAGIGTMTFYDPATGQFAALGHGISDMDTGLLMPLQSGAIMPSSVTDVKKGEAGSPGELHGAFQTGTDLGALLANTDSGIFGALADADCFNQHTPMPVADRKQVKTGPATILSNINGETVAEYDIEIVKLYAGTGSDTRDMTIKVTDPRLLEKTGGIVQGMSGSPILQDGRLIGAVTHVLVNDPTSGYGILAERMLRRADHESLDAAS